jgi:hypothetical protein
VQAITDLLTPETEHFIAKYANNWETYSSAALRLLIEWEGRIDLENSLFRRESWMPNERE